MIRTLRFPLFLCLGLAGCMKTTKPDPLADVTGFCEAWAEQACNADVVSHCSAASANACVAKQQSFCETLVPASKYSEQGALDCLDAVGKAYEDTVLTADERDTVLHLAAPCDKVLSGPGNEGDTCTVESDCDTNTGLTCVKKSPTGKGYCYVPKIVGGGLDCSADSDVCDTGFYCSSDSHCISANTSGETCSADVPCDPGSRCLTTSGAALGSSDGGSDSGTCQARSALGEACSTDDDCASSICAGASSTAKGACSQNIVLSFTDPVCDDLR